MKWDVCLSQIQLRNEIQNLLPIGISNVNCNRYIQ